MIFYCQQNGTKPQFHNDVNLVNIAKNPLCDGFTGADLAALVRDASMLALREIIFSSKSDNDFGSVFVTAKHFEQALQNLRPSVSEKVNIFIWIHFLYNYPLMFTDFYIILLSVLTL